MSSRRKSIGVGMAGRKTISAVGAMALIASVVVSALGQYPGQVKKKSKDSPELRAIAVLEWTGDLGKPKACRMVPVTVFDGEKLQDGGVYLARPEPLAVAGEVEYELKENGKTVGLFDIENAGQEQGSWVGYGKWKPLPQPKTPSAPQKIDAEEEAYNDKPVLHRKHPSGDAPGPTSGGSSTTESKPQSAPAGSDDPDRPKLHKKADDSGTTTGGSQQPADDPDRPKLEKKPETSKTPTSDPDQPNLQKARPDLAQDIGNVSSVDSGDPDRPTLKRGKSAGVGGDLAPTLMGMPPDMQQAVAVSDAKNRPDHPWTYSWANPDDEKKMKAAMEDLARKALGLPGSQPETASAPKRTGTAARRTAKAAAPPAEPAPLEDEQFRVFELTYGSGATMVLSAHTQGPVEGRKFVTIVGQPDLYGNVLVLLKSVTDTAHLDETPRMRLVDAVDALADNRGELLFELRGAGARQFALYRIYRGTAEKLFVSGGGVYGSLSSN
jgi:hypothetical protein